MGLRNIFRFSNLSGVNAAWVKPNAAKAKYIEIKAADCTAIAVDKTETKWKLTLPRLDCKMGRQAFNGYTFMVTFHPALKLGTLIVEGEVGVDIFADVGPLVIKDDVALLGWLARVYELDTALTGG
jgi:hypothetical protein